MAKKDYCVIEGGKTYRLITPEEAIALLETPGNTTKVYAILTPEEMKRYNDSLEPGDIRISRVEPLGAASDVDLFLRDFGAHQFGIKVGNLPNMLLNMEE